MNLIKSIVLAFFLVTFAVSASAQERYEQMMITYSPGDHGLFTSKDNGEWKEEAVPKSERKSIHDVTPALIRIKEHSEQGWELYQNSVSLSGGGAQVFTFHLRRQLK